MESIDWIVLGVTLMAIVGYGTWKTRGSKNVQDYIRGGNQAQWWTIGLSVMATQASAITFLSTPGQAFHDGMGFVQFYFGVPIAMIIICMVFIPIYHKLKVYTAYEFLEERFDLKTRSLTAGLFLIQRGLAAGITIYAPAIILSSILKWNLNLLNIAIGILVIIYTVSGGTKAVSVTQKQQMAVIFIGMFIAFGLILSYLPDNITFSKAMDIAGASNKMNILDFSFNLENRYTVWSGLIGGSFLALSYFGTDQSQVQRYLSGKSVREMRLGLIFNGLLKVPMQFFILLVGVMVFVFYQFNQSPINFNPRAQEVINGSSYTNEYKSLKEQQKLVYNGKKDLIENYLNTPSEEEKLELVKLNQVDRSNRGVAKELIAKAAREQKVDIETNDKDYVFIHFILNNLPKGLIGLLLAVILSAAMSSTASELNALASTTTIDLYKRNMVKDKDDLHYVKATKWFTLGWGLLAITIACLAYLADNLIQLVNIIGSIFYGNVLGIFLLAFFFKFVKGHAVFIAAIITQIIVIIGWWQDWMPYLWLNLFGCTLVILIAIILEKLNLKKGNNI
ncbi:sodium:solute symporter [Mangrovimonas aestuarii]|uniref:sodium:solute symporter n=1 Tax=Mangrovimonas aestuarii TaxID=3018443 RepID=UPI002379B8D6|nr:sodium:solute symporter [Mangrovimonas aestuarii]